MFDRPDLASDVTVHDMRVLYTIEMRDNIMLFVNKVISLAVIDPVPVQRFDMCPFIVHRSSVHILASHPPWTCDPHLSRRRLSLTVLDSPLTLAVGHYRESRGA